MPKSIEPKRAKRFTKTPPLASREIKLLPVPVAVNNSRAALRLLSRIIREVQLGEIDMNKAKSIAYLVQVYVTVLRETETEARIQAIEDRLDRAGRV